MFRTMIGCPVSDSRIQEQANRIGIEMTCVIQV